MVPAPGPHSRIALLYRLIKAALKPPRLPARSLTRLRQRRADRFNGRVAIAPQPIPLAQRSALPATPRPEPAALPCRRALFKQTALAPLHAWHLLSLDAPTIAVLWAFCFARALRQTLSPYALTLLFTGTWLLYITDRVLDGLRHNPARLRERHLFYIRHRTAALIASAPASLFLLWLVFFHMLPSARRADILIFGIVVAYFALIHLHSHAIEHWFPKELIVSLVFASATAAPVLVRLTPAGTQAVARARFVLLFLSLLFAALCWLNCLAIEKWEQVYAETRMAPINFPLGYSLQAPIAHRTTLWGQRRLRPVSIALSAIAFAASALLLHSNPSAAGLCFAAALAAVLFIPLDHSRLSAFHLRIAADAALLTPLLLIFFIR